MYGVRFALSAALRAQPNITKALADATVWIVFFRLGKVLGNNEFSGKNEPRGWDPAGVQKSYYRTEPRLAWNTYNRTK